MWFLSYGSRKSGYTLTIFRKNVTFELELLARRFRVLPVGLQISSIPCWKARKLYFWLKDIKTVWPFMCPWSVKNNHSVLIDQPRTYEWSNRSDLYLRQKNSFLAFQQGIDEICRLTGSTRNWRANSASSKFTFFRKIVKVYPDFREP